MRSLAVQAAERVGGGLLETVLAALDAADKAGLSLRVYVEKVLAGPLLSAAKPDGGPLVVVVDALDEGGRDSASNELLHVVRWLPSLLPDWVRVLVTSRPEPYIMDALATHDPRVLEPTDKQNVEDLRDFTRGCLSAGMSEEERNEVVSIIEQRSQGIIGYVAAVVNMVREGQEGGLRSVKVGDLPEGSKALYAEYMDRQFGWLKDEERAAVLERLLPALVAAEEPLSVRDLERLVKHGGTADMKDEVVKRVLQAAGSLFPVAEDGRMRPYHKVR